MKLSAAITAVGRALRTPSDLLPFYFLGAAVSIIARTVPLFGLAVAWFYLEATGRLEQFHTDVSEIASQPPDLETQPEAYFEWLNEVVASTAVLFPPTVVALLVLSGVLALVVSLALSAAFSAGQIAACFGRLRDERGLSTGLAGARRFWLTFLGLLVFELALFAVITVTLAFFATAIGATLFAVTGSTTVAALVALPALAIWLVAAVAIRALFAFAPVSIVVDDRGVLGALSASYRFVRARPVEAVFYYVVALAVLGGVTSLLSVLAVVGAGSLVTLISLAVIPPVLDLLKTVLYGTYRDAVAPPPAFDRSPRSQLVGGVRHGIAEMSAFVRATPGIHALVVLVGVVSFLFGWVAAGPFTEFFEASISARLEGFIPPIEALNFFGNNWTVALTTAFSGIAFAIPALSSIAFNGVFIGATARLEVAPLELLAFVLPHGIFEIPAILIAGAVGVYIGLASWRTVRGRASRDDLADALERAFWVLIGVGVLLAIAAFIEGFISPYYWRPFL